MDLLVKWIWFGILFRLPMYGCLDLHFSETLQPGATLVNISLGPGWHYKVDRRLTPKSIRHYIKIERSDGVVYLARKVDCSRLMRHPLPLSLRVSSSLSENFVLIHFNAFVHGQNCFIKYKRKNLKHKLDALIYLHSGYGACLTSSMLPISIYEHLPVFTRESQMLRSTCKEIDQREEDKSASHTEQCLPRDAHLLCTVPSSRHGVIFLQVNLQFSLKASQGLSVKSERWLRDPWVKRKKRNVNSPPQFQLPNYQVSVPENEPPATRVITLKASDPDHGDAGKVEYDMDAIFDSRSNDYFQINPETGGITTLQGLDRETKDTHIFKVMATDKGTPKRSATAYLTITVSDRNDHRPVFEQTEYRVSIRENVEEGFEVMTIRAIDGDAPSNANMIYRIVNEGEVNSGFEIDPRNGLVKIRICPDREVQSQYQLLVEANDQGKEPGPLSATATVHITVEDENDNYPQFSEKRYVVQVLENIAVNSKVAQVKATDKDAGNNAKVHYSIISGNVKGQFYIHSPTGVIDVISPLDYEMIREYNLRVKAQDGGRPPLINNTGMVTVQVVDVNDNAPMFVSTPFQASVLENVPVGHSVIHVQAIDADSGDNAHLEYSLTDLSPGFPFVINNSTGWITVSRELDRETTEFYTFGIEVVDHGVPVMSSSASVGVTVLDVNDNAPAFTHTNYNLKINEDAAVGVGVLTVTAVDRDAHSVVAYQISSGNTRNRFAITSQSGGGLITLALPLDYKQERQYVLTVTASDGMRFDTAQVVINVTDTNTHRPVFQSANYQVSLSEERPVGSTVVVISATDEDTGENARITYMMEDNVPQFRINPDTGAITTQIQIDYEDQASYTLAIIARDNGVPQKSDTTYVEIIVLDANDNAPQFVRDIYRGTVVEDAPVYMSVLQVAASDRDSGSNGRVSYTFQGGDDGEGDFFIEANSGIIRTARKLDRENVATYNLKAFAVDKGVPPLKAAVDVQVTVLDINDNAPVFEKDELFIYVKENSAVGSTLARVSATDPDEGTNAQILYQIVEGNVPEVFQLDIFSGDLIALTDLDYEAKMEYVIVVQATSAPLVSRATVHVRLVDVNDNHPVLQDFEIIFNNYVTNKSNSFPLDVIGKVPARDPDVSDKLVYSFVEGNELHLLILNQDTGELKLSQDLDTNRPLEATMRVTVTDGLHQVSALCTLRATIITDEMLSNSVTVRLENVSQKSFLSPLLGLFVQGVASVLSTSREGVFVFNVQNDTDVPGGVLNVTFSALLPGGAPGRFFPTEELQEQLYLKRTLLTLVTAQRVMPFDDNVCLREPCQNYMKCVAALRFDSSAPFVASDAVLFRPIRPVNGLRCRCPTGFTGDYCETEIDLCYSAPCRNNGRCHSREGGYTCECPQGFTGEHCEVNSRTGRCVPGVCRNGGRCVDLLVGGFVCQCPEGALEKPYCQMTTRSFPGKAFVTFRGLRQRFHFTMSFMFATRERNALLLYNGRFNERHDFIAVEIVEEQIQLTFSAGESKTTVAPFLAGGVSDGQWHTVHLHYYNKPNIGQFGLPHGPSEEKVAVVSVDDCDVAMAVRFGGQVGNYTCAAQGTQKGQKKSLDLTGPLLLGGVPDLPDFPIRNRNFVGCMQNLTIDGAPIDMAASIANNGTGAGCPAKKDFCSGVVCHNGGLCVNNWSTYSCKCPLGYGGKNCEHVMPSPLHFDGHAMVSWSDPDITIAIPWYVGLMFRTRKTGGVLLQAGAGEQSRFNLLVSNRHLCFQVFLGAQRVARLEFPQVRVNDGEWHHVLVELKSGKDGKDIKYMALVSLDYGVFQGTVEIGNELPGCRLRTLSVGGLAKKNGTVLNGFDGCMQGVRMGETSTNTVNVNMRQATRVRVRDGCDVASMCVSNVCPPHSRCRDSWSSRSCVCEPGYFGSGCVDACLLNPCEHASTCVRKPATEHGYTCQCAHGHYGRYCEHRGDQPCARGWWGYPNCGPCNCDVNKGFRRECNQSTGVCSCKDNYYRPAESDTCYPCECFHLGAHSRTCDPLTGQCPCKMGVVGRQCNRCDNPFAEVTTTGCVVVYEGCPKSFEAGIWWPRTTFGGPAAMDCPKGSTGTAVRHCSEEQGWLPPELLNCTSLSFARLRKENEELRANSSRLDGGQARELVAWLGAVASEPAGSVYSSDVRTAYELMSSILQHESLQQGFDLAATHDSSFNQDLVKAASAVLDPVKEQHWDLIQRSGGNTAELLRHFEDYANTLARNMRKTYLKPFTIISDNMLVSADMLDSSTSELTELPRFNEIKEVYSKELESSVFFPDLLMKPPVSRDIITAEDPLKSDATPYPGADGTYSPPLVGPASSAKKRRHTELGDPPSVAMVIIYRSLGQLLPETYDPDRRSLRLPARPVINSPVVTVVVHREREAPALLMQSPITLLFRLLETQERTKPVCVYWNHSISAGGSGGWSARGCELVFRNSTHISCQCYHMTSFAVLMDISKREHGDVLPLKAVTYSTVSTSLVALLITFLLLAILRKLRSNLHSIHKNLVAAIFLSELIFLAGINQTDNPFACTVVAILLHYSYMCTFTWMFVEGLHIYRMLTEMRNINQGHMRFYYAIGWGVPAVITGLAVGLDPQGYGNPDFCWLSVHDTLIWSITGPISFVVLINIVIFMLAAKASCVRGQRALEKSGAISALRVSFLLLLIISATWLLGLMAVNSDVLTFHYLFAILTCLQGICIFFLHCVLNKDVRIGLQSAFAGSKVPAEESSTTRITLLTRSLNGNMSVEDGCLYRTPFGESTVSLENSARSGKSHRSSCLAYTFREDQKRGAPPSGRKERCNEVDSSSFFKKSKRREDSDSDSELSVDEHSSSYASSQSSDSEEEEKRKRPKFNNERCPSHSTPKVDAVPNHVKPYWRVEPSVASEGKGDGGLEKLRVEAKGSVELQEPKRPGANGEIPQSEGPPSLPGSSQMPRRGILKNKITHPPPLTDKNLKNHLSEKTCDYPHSVLRKTPPAGSSEGSVGNGVIMEDPALSLCPPLNGVTAELSRSGVHAADHTDSDGSNETSV